MITDEYLLALVPPAMERAREGPAEWERARIDLSSAFEVNLVEGNHYRACVIAHYVGFLSVNDPDEQLRWNRRALEHAELAERSDVASFMPSLFASVGAARRARGEPMEALAAYERAAAHIDALAGGAYGEKIRVQIDDVIKVLRDG